MSTIHSIDFPNYRGRRILGQHKELAMYAIAGVTGHVGSVAAETLLSQGKAVRVIVRDAAKGAPWKAKGAEVAVADLNDEAALTRALAGTSGAFVLLPPTQTVTSEQPIEDNARLARTIAAAVKAAKLPHVVLLSSVGAQHADGNGPIKALHYAEKELAATGAAVTAVRASYFQENWGAALGALAQGILPTFVRKDVRYPQVSTRDIGRTVASALVEGGKHVSAIELAGPRDYTGEDIAAALSKITGKSIPAVDAPLDQVVPTFTSFGLSNAVAQLYREMYEGIMNGRVAPEAGNRIVRGSVDVSETLAALLASK
jgi:uncharacterized protein YbjT (DUF2867 family)